MAEQEKGSYYKFEVVKSEKSIRKNKRSVVEVFVPDNEEPEEIVIKWVKANSSTIEWENDEDDVEDEEIYVYDFWELKD